MNLQSFTNLKVFKGITLTFLTIGLLGLIFHRVFMDMDCRCFYMGFYPHLWLAHIESSLHGYDPLDVHNNGGGNVIEALICIVSIMVSAVGTIVAGLFAASGIGELWKRWVLEKPIGG